MNNYELAQAFIRKAKESYRADARRQTWEEKVEAIERMREAAAEARQAMRRAMAEQGE